MTFNFSKFYFKTRRPLVAFAAILVMLGSLVAGSVFAAEPRFNFEPADLKTLSVRNVTQNTGWQDYSVSASNNDQVAFQVYYRNGVPDSIARNTRVRLTFPTGAQNAISVNVSLSADNAPAVYDSVTINSATAQRLTFDANNIRWFPDQTTAPSIRSASSNGAGYIEINLGDIGPCWEHQGYVNFYASLAPDQVNNYNFTILKSVRNQTAGQTTFSDSTNANAGDRLNFQIQLANTGNAELTNFVVRDVLPSQLNYISGTTKLGAQPTGDALIGSGLHLGAIPVGQSRTITFDATAASVSFPQTATNYAYARPDQVNEKSDAASVVLSYVPPANYDLSIAKTVRNITAGNYNFTESVNANANDRLAFQLVVRNTGNAPANNVMVGDFLPTSLNAVAGSVRLDGAAAGDSAMTSAGLNIGTLAVGQTRTITFEAIASNIGNGGYSITNTGFTCAYGVGERLDTATIYFNLVPTPTPTPTITPTPTPTPTPYLNLSVAKTVRNITSGQGNYSESVNAASNDRLGFQIQIQNTGNAAVNNVMVRDSLPGQLNYVSGSTRLDGNYQNDGLAGGNINIGSLAQGQTRTLTFEAIANNVGSGNYSITNTAYASGDSVSERSDTAMVYFNQSGSGNLTIEKMVRNNSSGQSYFSETANANSGERVTWQIQVRNNGSGALNNLFVYDTLPTYTNYISGTTRVDGSYQGDGIVSGGINLGSLNSGNTRTITFETDINSYYNSGYQTLTNYAYARADQIGERSDTASVYINQSYSQGNLNISKTVRNTTTGTAMQSSVNANIGDRVMFLIQITTPGNSQLYNVRVWDTLPSGLSYVQGSTRIDNAYTNDGLVSGGLSLGAISANQSRSINFEATVNSYGGLQTITNYAYASADNVGQRSAFAQVITTGTNPVIINPSSGITKRVDNLTSPNGTQTNNTAAVGHRLRYTLSYYNNGSNNLTNVRFVDTLPSYTSFISADNGGSYNSGTNQITWAIGSLAAGATAQVAYEVNVINVPYSGFVIANTAAFAADGLGPIDSNEVRTSVTTGVVKGAVIGAVTGGDDLTRNIAISLLVAMWGIFFLWLYNEYQPNVDWQNLKFKYAVWRIKMKEKVM